MTLMDDPFINAMLHIRTANRYSGQDPAITDCKTPGITRERNSTTSISNFIESRSMLLEYSRLDGRTDGRIRPTHNAFSLCTTCKESSIS
ncbi:hypothetical protein L798_13699 [Zootermopsis nevadensis]|uniref:Uncharacterized protein n=1 Tax=Zootermopsis nevadensis TaxID=136037 RepID=A0A067QSI6_ZOONE|nr:hypothetical protein L798_13699 [Zootermopsis nevadensis]